MYDRRPPLAQSTQLSDGSSWFDVITTLVRKLTQAFIGTPVPFAKDSHPIDSQTALIESVLAGNDYPSSSNSPGFMTLMGDEDTIVMETDMRGVNKLNNRVDMSSEDILIVRDIDRSQMSNSNINESVLTLASQESVSDNTNGINNTIMKKSVDSHMLPIHSMGSPPPAQYVNTDISQTSNDENESWLIPADQVPVSKNIKNNITLSEAVDPCILLSDSVEPLLPVQCVDNMVRSKSDHSDHGDNSHEFTIQQTQKTNRTDRDAKSRSQYIGLRTLLSDTQIEIIPTT